MSARDELLQKYKQQSGAPQVGGSAKEELRQKYGITETYTPKATAPMLPKAQQTNLGGETHQGYLNAGDKDRSQYASLGAQNKSNPFNSAGKIFGGLSGEEELLYSAATQDEKNYINYLYGKYDKNDAKQMARKYWNDKASDALLALSRENSIEGKAAKYVTAPGTNILGTQAGMLHGAEVAVQAALNPEKAIPDYSPGSQAAETAKRSAQTLTDRAGPVESFLTSGALSISNNLVNRALWGVLGPAAMGVQAGSSKAYDVGQKGGTVRQQLISGIAAGGAEYLGESISFGALNDILKGAAPSTIMEWAKLIGSQMITEGLEESATEVMNILSDYAIMGKKSDFSEHMAQYLADHPEKAKDKALVTGLEALKQIGYAGAQGAFSGGIMGGGGAVINTMQSNRSNASANAQQTNNNLDQTMDIFNGKPVQASPDAVATAQEGPAASSASVDPSTQAKLDTRDSDILVAKLKANVPLMQNTQPVAQITGSEFAKGPQRLTEQVGEFFKSLGNKVTRQGFGDVILDVRGVKDSSAHGLGRTKSAAFAAVPDVIQKGMQIDHQTNWKGRGYDTYVFAGPMLVGEGSSAQKSYIAAVVTQRSKNRYYLHEVLDGDGNVIYAKKDGTADPIKTSLLPNGSTSESTVPSDPIIPNQDNGVKGSVSEGKQKNTSARLSAEEVTKIQRELQTARKNRDKAVAKHKLTEAENKIVDQFLEGIRDTVPRGGNLNLQGIHDVYEAKKAVRDVDAVLKANKKQVRGDYAAQAEAMVEGSENWEDKNAGILYSRETMERNIRDVVRDPAEAQKIIDEYFTPVHENTAKATKKTNEINAKVKALGIDTTEKYLYMVPGKSPIRVSESGLVQLLGEGIINETQVEIMGADLKKISNAVQVFREIYNDLFQLSNEALVRNGYDPVEFRQDYFPHFQEAMPDSWIMKALAKVGIKIDTGKLPTDIAGLTHTFRPGKKWVGNFLRRTGSQTEYNALKGLDKYLPGVADVIYHTDDIQRLRALENAIRHKHSDAGMQERIEQIKRIDGLTDEQKQTLLTDEYKSDKSHLANLAVEIRQYTDALAGKKSFSDRDWEMKIGRGAYNVFNAVESRIAANMVGGNISSALTNVIPIFQSVGEVNPIYTAKAIWDFGKSVMSDDGFGDQSTFITNRRGTEKLYRTGLQKATDIASMPFQAVDSFTSEVLTRAKYLQNIDGGMGETSAMEDADAWAASVIADRSKGALPTLFETKNPLYRAFTMFQLEVNNQFSYYFKDIPRTKREEGLAAIAIALFKIFIATAIYGELFKKTAGYDPTFNPIRLAADFAGDIADEDVSAPQAILNLGENTAKELPFVGNLMGGGRLPVQGVMPDFSKIVKSLGQENAGDVVLKELTSPAALLLPPLGGNQIKKTVQGLSTVAKGGSYTKDKDGNEKLQYLVEPTVPNWMRGALFGKWSFPEAQAYIDGGFKPLSAGYTEGMKKAEASGVPPQIFMKVYDAQRAATSDKDADGKTKPLSLSKNKKKAIDNAAPFCTKRQKELLYEIFGVSKEAW